MSSIEKNLPSVEQLEYVLNWLKEKDYLTDSPEGMKEEFLRDTHYYSAKEAGEQLTLELLRALDACFGVMMQPYLIESDKAKETAHRLGVSMHSEIWAEARRNAERMYYEVTKPKRGEQPAASFTSVCKNLLQPNANGWNDVAEYVGSYGDLYDNDTKDIIYKEICGYLQSLSSKLEHTESDSAKNAQTGANIYLNQVEENFGPRGGYGYTINQSS